MLEARSAYGYYGSAGGVTGEVAPKEHKRGWHFYTFHFEVNGAKGYDKIMIRACDYDHAMKQAKQWAKRDGFTIVKEVI